MNPLYTLVARALLSILFIGGFGAITMYVLTQDADFPPGVKEVILYLMGALTTGVITVVNFWFSSTQGSADKSAAMYVPDRPADRRSGAAAGDAAGERWTYDTRYHVRERVPAGRGDGAGADEGADGGVHPAGS